MIRSVSLLKPKNKVWKAFFLGLFIGLAALLPYVISDNGMFIYYGDFNAQQIPFYQLANEAVNSGNMLWSWNTDLGANFIGSYSFYLLFSPFFWLTLPFPPEAIPYLMAPLMALKMACASATGYLFLKRFVRDADYAVLTSLLYAFSGFSLYNVVFNHFHEAIIFFPLLLVGLEIAMTEEKRGYFALAVAVNAMVNYWFFIGEVVFVIIYFLVRFTDPSWKITLRKFVCLSIEAVLGLAMVMVVFLPSVLAILGNPRTDSSNLLLGNDLWYYISPQRYLGLFHSLVFTPDMPALNNWFPDHESDWSSLSAYIPMFSISMVLAWMMSSGKHWLKRMLIICGIMAVVPAFNHAFVMWNQTYYARWFYMPTLLMVLATAKALEDSYDGGKVDPWKGIKITGVSMAILICISGFTPFIEDGVLTFGNYNFLNKFLATLAITLVGFFMVVLLMRHRDSPTFKKKLTVLMIVGSFLYTFFVLLIGETVNWNNQFIYETALPGRDNMSMSQPDVFERSDIYEDDSNLGMYWNLPSIQSFHSIIPVSIMEFYPSIGIPRETTSNPGSDYPELRSLLSVRWLYVKEDSIEQPPMTGYELADNRLGYNIYQNENYIPMGFTYQRFITKEEWETLPKKNRSRTLLYAIYLEDETIERVGDILQPFGDEGADYLFSVDYEEVVKDRAQNTCDTFTIDNQGFTATSNFSDDELVFFSVPYDKGWTATVNGEPAIIENVNVGFMAVRVPLGESVIRFDYMTPGLTHGLWISLGSFILFLSYLAFHKFGKKNAYIKNKSIRPSSKP